MCTLCSLQLCIFTPFCINPDLSGITSKAFGEKHSTLISTKAADARLEEKSEVHNLRKKSGRDNLWHNLGQSCFGKSQLCTISVVALALFVAHAQCWSQLNLAGRVKLWGKVSSRCGTCSTYGKILVNSRKSEQGIFSVVAQSHPSSCGAISEDSRKIKQGTISCGTCWTCGRISVIKAQSLFWHLLDLRKSEQGTISLVAQSLLWHLLDRPICAAAT